MAALRLLATHRCLINIRKYVRNNTSVEDGYSEILHAVAFALRESFISKQRLIRDVLQLIFVPARAEAFVVVPFLLARMRLGLKVHSLRLLRMYIPLKHLEPGWSTWRQVGEAP